MVLKDEAPAKVRQPGPAAAKPAAAAPRGSAGARALFKGRRGIALGVAAAILAGAGAALVPKLFKNATAEYVTATVARGSVEDTVTALGNLQPLNYVDVGAQVSGQIQAIHVNIGDRVKKGDLLVEIDPKVQQARVDESRSQLVSAQAQLLQRQADLKLKQAAAAREERLHAAGADSQAEYEAAMAALATAQAAVKAQQAQIEQAQSTLNADTTTLSYATIRAPMDGTVVSVAVKPGQTINAAQQSPTILRIADLSTMTAWTQVSEADIPRLKVGMPAYLTTLGDAATRHPGKLRQILPTPEIQNNVVLYNALFDVPNEDGSLMTQMTAQVFFEVASARNVLTVPVAALQMGRSAGGRQGQARSAAAQDQPPAAASTPGNGEGSRTRGGSGSAARGSFTDEQRAAWRAARANGGGSAGRSGSGSDAGRRQFVMVVAKDGSLERRAVAVGVSNRISAEIISGLEEGETVVVGRKLAKAQAASLNSAQRSMLQQPGFGGPPGAGRGPR